jgi:hypothetical protein
MDCEFYVVINKTDKTLIMCLLIFLFSIGNCHFNDILHFQVKLKSVHDVKSLAWMTREKLQVNKAH